MVDATMELEAPRLIWAKLGYSSWMEQCGRVKFPGPATFTRGAGCHASTDDTPSRMPWDAHAAIATANNNLEAVNGLSKSNHRSSRPAHRTTSPSNRTTHEPTHD
ncbi:Uncharacterized protein Fot_19701 [Forsythia ovata]|uniref:Uncharacterized protein n=1 Tax=Forsythia ovata TaxID=205694 RepID=A0ABD1VPL3_9LAMI